jgi:hypothetical protein
MGEALKIEEYVPLKTPTNKIITKCRMVMPPKIARDKSVSITVSWVLIERASV